MSGILVDCCNSQKEKSLNDLGSLRLSVVRPEELRGGFRLQGKKLNYITIYQTLCNTNRADAYIHVQGNKQAR